MNGQEKHATLRERTFSRLDKSARGLRSDRHAAFFYYTFPFFHSAGGVELDGYFHDPKVIFESQLEVLERLDNCGNLTPDEGPAAECSALGCEVRFDKHGFISVKEMGIEPEDVLKLKPGDPYGGNYMRRALEQLEYMVQNAPGHIGVNAPVLMGPFTVAAQLRGISNMCVDIIEEPEMAAELLAVCAETSVRFMKAAVKIMGRLPGHILVADDISSFLSPGQYGEWVAPYYELIFKEFPGVRRWLHNDAQAAHIMPQIAESGWDAWQYAPSIDPLEALKATGGKVALLGGLNPVELQSKNPEETYALCVERLKYFGGDTRLALAPGGSVNQVPVENLKAILAAADEFEI